MRTLWASTICLTAAVVAGLSVASVPMPAEAKAKAARTPVVASRPQRTMVGDWEPVSNVVVVYSDGWPTTFRTIVSAVAETTPVTVLVEDSVAPSEAREVLSELPVAVRRRVQLFDAFVDSAWSRDWGPLQARNEYGAVTWLDAEYSSERPRDDDAPRLLANLLKQRVRIESLPVLFDGGAIASNGAGVCVSTRDFFDAWSLDQADVQILSESLGCEHLLLVPALVDESTHHVDVFLQFVEPDVVTLAAFDPGEHGEDAERMNIAAEILLEAARAMNWPLSIHRVPVPFNALGLRYHAYTNYFRLPHMALVPHFRSVPRAIEDQAYDAIADAIPSVDIVPIPADEVLEYGGLIHCLTLGVVG